MTSIRGILHLEEGRNTQPSEKNRKKKKLLTAETDDPKDK